MRRGLTIDSACSQDLDDAIAVRRLSSGGFKVYVFISNVAAYVPKGHDLDEQAINRLATAYRPGKIHHMLPAGLSTDRLSLVPGKKRKVVSVEITLDANLESDGLPKLRLGPFKSTRKLAHPDIPRLLKEGDEDLSLMATLATNLLEKRRANGALAIYDLLEGWATTEEGFLVKLPREDSSIGYVIVQEFMVLANESMARWAAAKNVPILFRNHQAKAAAPPQQTIVAQLEMAGLTPGLMQGIQERLHLLVERARYSPVALGHYGLNLPLYSHVTSPIRRYADLVTQRQLSAALDGKDLPYTQEELKQVGKHINSTLDARKEASREFFRERSRDVAQRRLSSGTLQNIEPRDFEKVTKALLEGNNPATQEYLTAFRHRIRQQRITPKDIARIVVSSDRDDPGWRALSQDIINWLADNAHWATSALHIACQAFCGSTLSFEVERGDRGRNTPHRARGKMQSQDGCYTQTRWLSASTVKLAKQWVAVVLLAEIPALEIPKFPEPEILDQ